MAGTILENLSTRKMLMICGVLFVMELICILVGACIAPTPSLVHHQISTSCAKERHHPRNRWYLPQKCHKASLEPSTKNPHEPNDVVFALKIPQSNYSMTRWFQFMLTLLSLRTKYNTHLAIVPESRITLDIRVGYSNDPNALKSEEAWTELFRSREERTLECTFDRPLTEESHEFEYDCEPIHFFQLGSLPHQYYLINVVLPTTGQLNSKIGQVAHLEFVSITQTGGFTKVWISLKSVMFVILFFPMVWYWNRIQGLQRNASLLEKVIFGFALSMQFLNLPLELVTIYCDADWMLVFTDLRQGLVYVVLLCFWIIFVGEHLMDQAERNKLSSYKWHLSCISIATLSMLSFELAERGTQITRPSATIWNNHSMAYALLIVGAICAVIYMIMLLYLIIRSVRSIRYKRRFTLPDERRKKFERIVKRFYTLLFLTFATALVTVVFFFLQHAVGRMVEEWFSLDFESTSGFFTGVYGLWNIYVMVVLWLYAPSHKFYEDDQGDNEYLNGSAAATEQIQLMSMTQTKQAEE